jgi:predicted phosphodiesterase
MKVQIFSDIHLEHYHACEVFPFLQEGDVLILAGDILNAKHLKTNGYLKSVYQRFLEDCSKNYDKILYILGNHEPWGYNYEGSYRTIREALPDNFHLLENEFIKIGGWNFWGATFWTNFRNANVIEMMEAECLMNDYKTIRIGSNFRKLRAQDTLNIHNKSRDSLLNFLEDTKENVFIITHHAPSYQSVADEFKTAPCNSAYCSDYDGLILNNPQIKYFVHGHTHHPFDYMIGDCRVICNPVGYPKQQTGFNQELILTI